MSVRFYLDEDVQVFLAEALRTRGIDAVHVYEAKCGGQSDGAQLAFAAADRRCLVTYNKRDFVVLSRTSAEGQRPHFGIVAAVWRPVGDVLRALVAVAESCSEDDLRDQLLYV